MEMSGVWGRIIKIEREIFIQSGAIANLQLGDDLLVCIVI